MDIDEQDPEITKLMNVGFQVATQIIQMDVLDMPLDKIKDQFKILGGVLISSADGNYPIEKRSK